MERTATCLSDEEVREQVRKLLLGNISQGYAKALKTQYCFIRPSPGNYPFQFWWDTCFHVFILCALGDKEQLDTHLLLDPWTTCVPEVQRAEQKLTRPHRIQTRLVLVSALLPVR